MASADVDQWLAERGLQEFASVLRENDFTAVEDVVGLTDKDLSEMGVKLGKRKQFLRQAGAAPPPAAPAAAAASPAPPAAPAAPPRNIDTRALVRNPDCVGVTGAVSRLDTLLGNIARSPGDARYRVLKTGNAILAKEVFSIDGVSAFLTSAGFTECAEGWELPADQGVRNVQAALQTLAQVPLMSAMFDKERKRRLVASEVRRDKREAAAAKGAAAARAYARAELLALGEAGDLAAAAGLLRKVLDNVAAHPGEAKYRRIVARADGRFGRECWQARGTQEFLLDVAGWRAAREEGEDVVHCPDAASGAAARDAIAFLEGVVAESEKARKEEDERVREEARREMQKVMQTIKQAQEPSGGAAAAAGGGSSSGGAGGGGGRRVPMKEALRILTGGASAGVPAADTAISQRQEEDESATRLINEISASIELEHGLFGRQGLAAPWRIESRRLMAEWRRDRDIDALQRLKDEWEEKVSEAKRKTGRSLADIGRPGGDARADPAAVDPAAAAADAAAARLLR